MAADLVQSSGGDTCYMAERKSQSRGLMLIAVFKLLKALALLAVAIGALRLLHKDVAAIADHWVNAFRVDPHNKYLLMLLSKLTAVDDHKLKALSIGTFIYSGVFFTEGIGLALKKRWAEYFTIITTSSFLPLEVYEIFKDISVPKCLALVINIAVVIYLVRELRRHPKT